ncbi:hypothetical protein A2V56_04425 [Candidatus Woesebacteria bacterium RBG_19FT_COMBO_42_9]|uniref:Type II secretion system protein GspG C-terminal domain-containing protein n=1 Tax=Candidatus Woesebacteria bacterium RBG_16_42_24 TaxID=1802485 RepID=A0A1F7XLV8_9BACT|nr:MAG: hypothetical protein A2V97_04410 [Candidatus Woesebacteria bacterium RBG_16_42_24]OGM16211.1 MAG: hypothetical protein A2V56_04425 [Candidatus Woesebacteria bacterium RBG_19FT_COMBO_42_9]OGM68506.1 MAG: hypothetical protein A2985_04020 [Candidatus Woesebacteria bacterium RIFCSPLOWO2_01_FULL_43_11]
MKQVRKGFTLIELLVTIAIIGILATVSISALNPQRQLAKARDTQRKTDIYSIASAIYQFASEHSGDLPDTDGNPLTSNFPTSPTCVGTGGGCFNLGAAGDTEPVVPTYMAAMPKDPKTGTDANTGYLVNKDANGRIVLTATGEVDNPITVTK